MLHAASAAQCLGCGTRRPARIFEAAEVDMPYQACLSTPEAS